MKPALRQWLGTTGASVINAVIGLVTGIIVAQLLGPDARGELAIVMFWAVVIATVAIGGLQQAAIVLNAGLPHERRDAFEANMLVFAAGSTAVGILIALLILPWTVASPLLSTGLIYTVAFLPLHLLGITLISLDHGSVRFGRYNVLRMIPQSVYLLGLIVLIFFGTASVQTVLISLWFGVLLTTGARLWLTRWPSASVNVGTLRTILSTDLRFYPSVLASLARDQIDRLVLIWFYPPRVVGLFAVAYTFVSIPVSTIVGGMSAIMMPRVSAEKDTSRKGAVIARYFRLSCLLSCVIVAPLIFAAAILPYLLGEAFADAVPIARLLCLASMFSALRLMIVAGIYSLNDGRLNFESEIVAVLAFLLFFLPAFWLNGDPLLVATAAMVAACVGLGWSVVRLSRKYDLPLQTFWPFSMTTIRDGQGLIEAQIGRGLGWKHAR